jgi:hypothetical protein
MIDFILRIIMTLILAELESLGSAQSTEPPTESAPSEPGTPEAVPIARGSEPAADAFSLLRNVDPCGLHDVAAATQVTGHDAAQIMPTESLDGCQLRMHRAPFEPSWTLTTRIGVAYGAAQRGAASPEVFDGRRMYRDESTDPHARTCGYTRPFGTDHGISLTVSAPLDEPAARPCPVARAYLLAARPLTNLVLRMERRTEPRLGLAAHDPCAATPAILRALGVSGAARPEAPYRCRIQPGTSTDDPHRDISITIAFGLIADPGELAGVGTGYQTVTVADHTGIAANFGAESQRCEFIVAHDAPLAISLNNTRFIQTIAVSADSCGQAHTAAAAALHEIATG